MTGEYENVEVFVRSPPRKAPATAFPTTQAPTMEPTTLIESGYYRTIDFARVKFLVEIPVDPLRMCLAPNSELKTAETVASFRAHTLDNLVQFAPFRRVLDKKNIFKSKLNATHIETTGGYAFKEDKVILQINVSYQMIF